MNDEPKVIYKYTHAQAEVDGELKRVTWPGPCKLYLSKDAEERFKREDDDSIGAMVAYALLMDDFNSKSWPGRTKGMHNGIEYELVRDFEIRDDDQKVPVVTIVAPGER